MPKFIIERDVPGVEKLGAADLQMASQKSCGIIRELGQQIQWQESYVADGRIFCIYLAQDEELLRKHGELLGLKAKNIYRVARMIDPTTGE